MKHLLLTSALASILFLGCSSVAPYKPSLTQEKASDSYRSRNVVKNGKVQYIISAIYLNNIYPKYPQETSNFVISVTSKNSSRLYFQKHLPLLAPDTYTLSMMDHSAIIVKLLENDDPLIELMPIHTKWSKYYYVSYPYVKGPPKLKLQGRDITPLILDFKATKSNLLLF